MKTAFFLPVAVNDRTMSTACVLSRGGGQVDRSCRGSAAEVDNTMVVRECTTREDAVSGIKKSVVKQKNRVVVRNLDGIESEFHEEEACIRSDDECFPNA